MPVQKIRIAIFHFLLNFIPLDKSILHFFMKFQSVQYCTCTLPMVFYLLFKDCLQYGEKLTVVGYKIYFLQTIVGT